MSEMIERPRPTDADHAVVVWPVVKLFLESDFTLTSLAKAIGTNRARVERAILDPGSSKLDIWAAMASALGAYIIPKLHERGHEWDEALKRAALTSETPA